MPAVLFAALAAAAVWVLDPPNVDLPAQVYRVGLFEREGFAAWDNAWYGGHHLPAYSLIFPPVGALLGLDLAGATAILVGTAAAAALAPQRAAAWFAAALAANVAAGRLPFALGTALAAWAVVAALRGRAAAGGALGVLATLTSPVAGAFLALGAAAALLAGAQRRPWIVAGGGVLVSGLAVGVLFPEGGDQSFAASDWAPALIATGAVALLVARRPVRIGAGLYALLVIAAVAVPNPLGSNAARLAPLLAGPLLVAELWPRRRRLLAALVIPLAALTLQAPVRDFTRLDDDPSRAPAYYDELLAQLAVRAGGRPVRVEIPFTLGRWEAARVAGPHLLARGWQRQLDRKVNALFYDDTPLTAERYRAWLDDAAVAWVALPDAPLDPSAQEEAELIRGGLPYLVEVWRGEHWRLFAVRDARPLGVSAVGTDWFSTRGGDVRIRWTPYWAIVAGSGCVRRGVGDWTTVDPRPAGALVRVGIRFDLRRVGADGPRCTDG